MLTQIFDWLSVILFPLNCAGCRTWLRPPLSRQGVCEACSSRVRRMTAPFCERCGRTRRSSEARCARCLEEQKDRPSNRMLYDRAYACLVYEGMAKELIHAYKYNGNRTLKNFFSEQAIRFVHAHMSGEVFDEVLAVPLEPRKLEARGFNQSRPISSGIARKLGISEGSWRLGRRASESPQFLLTKSQRESNIKDCFFVKNAEAIADKKLLLVDDVLTTGETASECSRVLKEAGASQVTVLACARGD